MQFADVVGQREVKEQLRKSVLLDRIAHTQLFRGGRGTGDLLLAITYAKYILCDDRNAKEACGVCTSCLSMDKLEHPDVRFSFPIKAEKEKTECNYFIEQFRAFVLRDSYADLRAWSDFHAENKNLEIRVKEAAAIAKQIVLRSYMGGHKVVIIWCAETMNREASNKLLKSIEEPPEDTVFLLVTSDPESLLPTIISRCQQHFVPKVDAESIEQYLSKRTDASETQAKDIALRCEGDVFTANLMLDDDSESMLPLFREWMLSCYYNKASDTNSACVEFQRLGRAGQRRFLQYGIQKIRQCVLFNQGADYLVYAIPEEKEFLKKFGRFITLDTAEWFREEFERMHYQLERNANAKVMFMDTSYQLYRKLKA